MTAYNKSVKIAPGAKAIKTDSVFITFEEMAKRGLGTIAFRDSWDILIKSWFRNRSFNKFFQVFESGYTKSFIQTPARDGSGFQ
jgi:hypothetical protein